MTHDTLDADAQRTKFDYLLNAFEQASQADKPAAHNYGDKRRALFAYVRDLERAAHPASAPTQRAVGECAAAFQRDFTPYRGSPDPWVVWQAAWASAMRSLVQSAAPADFQSRVQPWMAACFGPAISEDKIERNHRFLEEALELVQACGCTVEEAHQLVSYVYGRPVGEPVQEVGGVMVTLAALCLAHGMDMHAAGEVELARIWTKVEQIRAKQAAKPRNSPLPAAPAGAEPQLPRWWETFIGNVCEIPDRNSPEGEPEAMVATADELAHCALSAIESTAAPAPTPQAQPGEQAP